MTLGPTEMKLLRGWLVFLGVFEFPNLYNLLVANKRLEGFWSTMRNERASKRCWSFGLALLVFARFQAAADPTSKSALVHNAAVHILEAVVLGREYMVHGSKGSAPVMAIIALNAVWFASAAGRL